MTTEAIIFDYGNVLVGPLDEAAFEAEASALAHEHGFPTVRALWNHLYISREWEEAKRGYITHEEFWVRRLASLGLETEDARHQFKLRLFKYWGLRDEMRTLLDDLHGRYRLAVLSNTARTDFARYLVERRGLDGMFELVVGSADEGIAKPERELYRRVLSRLQLPAENVVFIDDQERNIRIAERLRIPCILFTSPAALRDTLTARGIL